uniref:Vipericidin n=1 Tax=Naja naja TaxID=35670 RepID=A0A8C6XWF6_NAJNA
PSPSPKSPSLEMMEGFFWKTLLVVGALTISGTSSFPHKPLTYEEAVDLAVSVYNSKSGEDSLYRLLEADALSESNQELNFSVKETVCQMAEERSLEECDFQEAGVSGWCQAGLDTPFRWRQACAASVGGGETFWGYKGQRRLQPKVGSSLRGFHRVP